MGRLQTSMTLAISALDDERQPQIDVAIVHHTTDVERCRSLSSRERRYHHLTGRPEAEKLRLSLDLGHKLKFRFLVTGIAAALIAGPAVAADLYVPAPPMAEPIAVSHWNGFYAGLHAGYGQGTISSSDETGTGAVAGAQIGYNADLGGFVLGVEGDVSWSGINGVDGVQTFNNDWLATLRARFGLPVDGLLFYGTVGVAAAAGEIFGGSSTQTATHYGWVAGAGIEAMVTDAISIRGEYLYYGLSEATYDFTPPVDRSATAQTFRVGANFHF